MKTKLSMNMGLLLLAAATLGTGCGTTSGLKPANREAKLDLSPFTKVAVRDFGNKFAERASADGRTGALTVGTHFADMVAAEIRSKGGFHEVSRTASADASTLVITGDVTRYQAGSAAARFWIGMGVGNSYFDASVEFRNGVDDSVVGKITVNKNSWPLGGGIAASQTPETFMVGAARKVAEEVHKAKTGNPRGDSPKGFKAEPGRRAGG